MKKTRGNFGSTLIYILPSLTCFYALQPAAAQDQVPGPALNVIPTLSRPALPPPPETPQLGQAVVVQPPTQPTLPQAWRIKALQLFKVNNSLDKNSVLNLRIHAAYGPAFEAITRALTDAGINLDALSFSSGHMLLSSPNERGPSDKAIIAMRQAAPDSDSSASHGTEVRVFCDSHNHSLTLVQVQSILSQVDNSVESNKDKAGAQTL